MSPETSRKFRLFSSGINALRAPLSMPTWSGSTRDRIGLMLPWILRSPRISRPGQNRVLLHRRVDGHNQGDPGFARHPVVQEVNGFDMEIGRVDLLADPHLHLLALQIGEGPLDRLLHWPFNAASDL